MKYKNIPKGYNVYRKNKVGNKYDPVGVAQTRYTIFFINILILRIKQNE